MSNTINQIDDSDIEEDDEDDFDEMWEDDHFSDADWEASVEKKYPGWYLVKLPDFSWTKLQTLSDWLDNNTKHGRYANVDWRSSCSTKVGVAFESGRDAMMFKLRWR
jgi:hypothetical protein